MKKIIFVAVSFTMLGLIYVAPISAQVVPSSSINEKGKISVLLGSPTSIDTVVRALQGGSFDMVSVQGSFTVSDQTIQDFMTITPSQEVSDVYSKWSNGRKALIAQLNKSDFFEKNAKFMSVNISIDDSAIFTIKNITVYGDKHSISNITRKFNGIYSDFESNSKANVLGEATASKKSLIPRK